MSRTVVILAVAAALIAAALVFLLSKSGGVRAPDLAAGPVSGASPEAASRPGSRATPAIRSEPFVESAPASNAAADAVRRLEIEVIGPKGKPASGAKLFLHRGDELLAQATTDAQGVAAFKEGEGDAQLIVIPDGSPIHRTSVSLPAGRRRVALPAGVSITGRVEVNGAAPDGPVTLRVYVDFYDLPAFVWKALKEDACATCTTTPAGDFELEGLREGSEWRVGPTLGYRGEDLIRDGRSVFTIPAPASGVILKLVRIPVICGRVVAEGSRVPVPRASCFVSYWGPFTSMSRVLEAGEDGRFSFPAASPYNRDDVFTRIELTVRGPDGNGEATRAFEPPPSQDVDLGNVEIPKGRTIKYVLRDPAGNPIEGGLAQGSQANEPDRASRTDAKGQGSLTIGPEDHAFFVGALKFEVAEVALPEPIPDLISVTLFSAAGIEAGVRTNPGVSPAMLRVRLSATTQDVFARDSAGNHPIHVAAGATANGPSSFDSDGATMAYIPDSSGHVIVAGLKPGVPLTVEAVDALGATHDKSVVTLDRAEWKKVDLSVTKSPRTLRGRVRDSAGKPIGGALVLVNSGHAVPGMTAAADTGNAATIVGLTDDEGRFRFLDLFASVVDLTVSKSGCVSAVRKGLAVPSGDDEIELTLQNAARLTVKVLEADGTPIRDLALAGVIEEYPEIHAQPKEPGVYVFSDVPPKSTVTIKTEWADREWTRVVVVKGDQTEQITMPSTGRVVADFSALGSPPFMITLQPLTEGERPAGQWVPPPASGSPYSREMTLSHVFPGEYTATVNADKADEVVIMAAPQRVTVRPGETTRIVFQKP